MKKYLMTLEVTIKEDWADIEDFVLEIQQFNESNKGVIEVSVKDINEKGSK